MIVSKTKLSPVDIDAREKLDFKAGDTVRVWFKILDEKGKSRLQAFEGIVLARKHGTEIGATFTVRKIASGVGVERIFPIFSPMIDKIEIVKKSRARRSKLYYVRTKAIKDVRRKMRSVTVQLGNKNKIKAKKDKEDIKETEAKIEDTKETVSTPNGVEVPAENIEEEKTAE